jgi:MarR family transcriptional regulator, organic hydroperoxide resistance regulator
MPDQHTLEETERVTAERLSHLELDFAAAQGVLSVYRAANAARAYLTAKVLRPHDLTWTGFLVLWTVWIWERVETRRIADSVGISKATLTGVAKTLMDRGWIERIQSTEDRRLVSLALTPAGKSLLDALYPDFNAAESAIVAGFAPDELDGMTAALRHFVKQVENLEGSA